MFIHCPLLCACPAGGHRSPRCPGGASLTLTRVDVVVVLLVEKAVVDELNANKTQVLYLERDMHVIIHHQTHFRNSIIEKWIVVETQVRHS